LGLSRGLKVMLEPKVLWLTILMGVKATHKRSFSKLGQLWVDKLPYLEGLSIQRQLWH